MDKHISATFHVTLELQGPNLTEEDVKAYLRAYLKRLSEEADRLHLRAIVSQDLEEKGKLGKYSTRVEFAEGYVDKVPTLPG